MNVALHGLIHDHGNVVCSGLIVRIRGALSGCVSELVWLVLGGR